MASFLKGKFLVGIIVGLLLGIILGYCSTLSRIGSLESQVSTLQGEAASRDAQIEVLQGTLASTQTQLAGNLTLLTRLRTWLSDNITRNAQLQAQVSTLSAQVENLRSQIASLKAEVEELRYGGVTLKVGKTGYPYSTIQEALDKAQLGDRVVVMDGATYEESLTIPVDNIMLDFRGATLKGTYVEDHEILLQARSYVTIKNGTVRNFGFSAILLTFSNQITVENMRVANNTRNGIFLWNSSYSTVTNNIVRNNKDCGISLMNGSTHNTISNNNASWNTCGIAAYHGCNYNILENNIMSNQKYEFGINIGHYSDNNRIFNNMANSNYWSGITLHDHSDNNTVENNIANSNRDTGIHLSFGASYNVIRNNAASYNVETQIAEDETCKGNIFLDNIAGPKGKLPLPGGNVTQNDAGLGRDAASDEEKADEVAPGNYTGHLDDADIYDYYKIYLNSGQTINIEMTPPAGADFDLILVSLGWIRTSFKMGSETDSVSFAVTSPGYYTFVIRQWQGAGIYSFKLAVEHS